MVRTWMLTVAGLDIEFGLDIETGDVSAELFGVSDRNELMNADEEGILRNHSPHLIIKEVKDGKLWIQDADNDRIIGVIDPFDEKHESRVLFSALSVCIAGAQEREYQEHHEQNKSCD